MNIKTEITPAPHRSKPLTVGIVGCGAIVRNVHLPVLLSMPQLQVVWISDSDEARAKALSISSGVKTINIARVLNESAPVDILLLAIPNGPRPPYIDLVRRGLAQCVYVEKPFAKTISEHTALTCGILDWQIAVGHDRRSFAIVRLARDVVESGIFGKLQSVGFEFGGIGRILTNGGYCGDAKLAGGGILYQMGTHYIDTINFITKSQNVELISGIMESDDGLDIHTEASLLLYLKDGSAVPFSVLATNLRQTSNKIVLGFERAKISFTPAYGESVLVVSDLHGLTLGRISPTLGHGATSVNTAFLNQWLSVIDVINLEKANEVNAVDCKITTKVFDLLYSLNPLSHEKK